MFKWNAKTLFYLRLIGLILIVFFLIFDFILAVLYPFPEFEVLSYSERISNYYSFFTTQSNYIVAVYFFVYLFESRFRHRKPAYLIKLAVTTYITVTMLVFWFGLFIAAQDTSRYSSYHWVSTIVLHLVLPIAMITSYVLTSGDIRYNIRAHHKVYLLAICSYPILYVITVSIRGFLRHLDNRPENTLYPYFFLNIYQPYGWLFLIFALIAITALFVGLQYLYIYINNVLFIKYKGRTLNEMMHNRIFRGYEKVNDDDEDEYYDDEEDDDEEDADEEENDLIE